MRATQFEFNYRFWIIAAIFSVGFGLSAFDHVKFYYGLQHLLAPSVERHSPEGLLLLRTIFGFGALLVFLAAMLRTWATAYLRTAVVHDPGLHSEALVADGPFRYVRNPLYLALIPMTMGIGFMASRSGWVFLVAAMWLFHYRLILREEFGLLETQGDSFRAYLKRVPRLWPSLTPRLPASGARPRWGQAFVGELFVWIFGFGVLSVAITLDSNFSGILIGVGMVLYVIMQTVIKRRASQSAAKA
jgi:protein-S-isoprenylcysteine O-methyltransferase Ste14